MSGGAPRAFVGLLGAGTIADRYVESLSAAQGFMVVAVASRSGASARAAALRYGMRNMTVAELLADTQVNYVLNLAPAAAHADLTMASLRAGKHVFSEKPMACTVEAADALIATAQQTARLLACAPAVLMWPALRTAAAIVQRGELGTLVGGFSSVIYPGPELFHPNPDHLYSEGAGSLFDMGVYGLTALLDILGPVAAVQAFGSQVTPRRTIKIGPRAGEGFSAVGPTTVLAQMRHQSGALSTLQVGFEAMGSRAPGLEIYGTRASISVARPFDPEGDVLISDAPGQWRIAELEAPAWRDEDWACGVTEAWSAFHADEVPHASASRARETLALMCAIESQCISQTHEAHWQSQNRSI